jgi:hypothetical protein
MSEALEYLGHAPSWLTAERRANLTAAGFPFPDPLLDRVDWHALDAWLDRCGCHLRHNEAQALTALSNRLSRCDRAAGEITYRGAP